MSAIEGSYRSIAPLVAPINQAPPTLGLPLEILISILKQANNPRAPLVCRLWRQLEPSYFNVTMLGRCLVEILPSEKWLFLLQPYRNEPILWGSVLEDKVIDRKLESLVWPLSNALKEPIGDPAVDPDGITLMTNLALGVAFLLSTRNLRLNSLDQKLIYLPLKAQCLAFAQDANQLALSQLARLAYLLDQCDEKEASQRVFTRCVELLEERRFESYAETTELLILCALTNQTLALDYMFGNPQAIPPIEKIFPDVSAQAIIRAPLCFNLTQCSAESVTQLFEAHIPTSIRRALFQTLQQQPELLCAVIPHLSENIYAELEKSITAWASKLSQSGKHALAIKVICLLRHSSSPTYDDNGREYLLKDLPAAELRHLLKLVCEASGKMEPSRFSMVQEIAALISEFKEDEFELLCQAMRDFTRDHPLGGSGAYYFFPCCDDKLFSNLTEEQVLTLIEKSVSSIPLKIRLLHSYVAFGEQPAKKRMLRIISALTPLLSSSDPFSTIACISRAELAFACKEHEIVTESLLQAKKMFRDHKSYTEGTRCSLQGLIAYKMCESKLPEAEGDLQSYKQLLDTTRPKYHQEHITHYSIFISGLSHIQPAKALEWAKKTIPIDYS